MSLLPTESDLALASTLLAKGTPRHRLAYSDRTAWLMACLSELAYLQFNPLIDDDRRRALTAQVDNILDKPRRAALMSLVSQLTSSPDSERQLLERELDFLNGALLATFDRGGTQAILVKLDLGLVLAFRGTEANRFTDIKADVNAVSVRCPGGGRVHCGFDQAYAWVADELKQALEAYPEEPLLITGHSLGGALATIAAKTLSHSGGVAACYTFGAPRVGDDFWICSIKTPVYRLVNAADAVPLLPPGSDAVTILGWLVRLIPGVGKAVQRWVLSKLGGYIHGGDMRYLTNCPPGDYQSVRLLYSVSFGYRLKAVVFNKVPWKRFLADHSIRVYRKKLALVALARNGGLKRAALNGTGQL